MWAESWGVGWTAGVNLATAQAAHFGAHGRRQLFTGSGALSLLLPVASWATAPAQLTPGEPPFSLPLETSLLSQPVWPHSAPPWRVLDFAAEVVTTSPPVEHGAQGEPEGHHDQAVPPAGPRGCDQRGGQAAAGGWWVAQAFLGPPCSPAIGWVGWGLSLACPPAVPLLWQQQLPGLAGQ